jgi:integrase
LPDLSDTRKRDLRSAVSSFGKVLERRLAEIPLDLAKIRQVLDGTVPAQAKVSRKRWANLQSDLAAAIAASGLQPMIATGNLELDGDWQTLFSATADRTVRNGLSRLARWASSRHYPPSAIDGEVLEVFFADLETATLVRNLAQLRRNVAKSWNRLASLLFDRGLHTVIVQSNKAVGGRVAWDTLPASFRREVDRYLTWCSVPDPLAEDARGRGLAVATRRLRRDYIHLAGSGACATGIDVRRLTSLGTLVEPETYRAILRQEWERRGNKITPYLRDLASGLIVIASEWVKVPVLQLDALKKLRAKLGASPSGLTEKNKAVLRRFDDERLQAALIQLPDTLWRGARRKLASSKLAFVDLQNALAIDILLHVPMRIENLAALTFDDHVHWPQGPKKPALVVIGADLVKNSVPLEFELPAVLANRLYIYRNEIAPEVIGRRPEAVFVTLKGKQRRISTMRVAIERTILRRLGVKITPHQFRHLAAKLQLDANPGAYELVRQLLGHKTLRTTTKFYAGVDTRRAGRAHADLLSRLRQAKLTRSSRRPSPEKEA